MMHLDIVWNNILVDKILLSAKHKDKSLSFLFHQLIVLRSIIRKYLWIESLDEIGEEAMRLKTAELAIRGLCKVSE